jgi:trehalose-phosphatase
MAMTAGRSVARMSETGRAYGSGARYEGVILDLDGVLTRTATQHARAWKEMFDEFMARRPEREGEDHRPFDIETDYLRYVDGKPRFDGVRSFLESRGIELPEGGEDDGPNRGTVRGLGMRKNEIFLALLEKEPVETFEDAVEQLRRWGEQGLGTALITSSRNGRRVLAAAGLEDEFDVIVDGTDAERLGIRGKPAPDIFLHAAAELGVEPGRAIVVEDALSGVEAGRAGDFGLVVGVARNGQEGLREAGADVVVRDLREVNDQTDDARGDADEVGEVGEVDAVGAATDARGSARDVAARLIDELEARRLVLFFDYDGTLTPIVRRPEDATLSDAMRSLLRELATHVTVGIVSGRDLDDVRSMVALDELYYAGSHGFDVRGPGELRMQHEEARDRLPELDAAEAELRDRLESVNGVRVERKGFAVAVHYREADEADVARVEAAVDDAIDRHDGLRKKGGKKIFELQPDVPWDKGRAVRWLLEQLELTGPDVLPVYVGDDETDEDAFEILSGDGEGHGDGVGIRVGSPDEPTRADYHLRDPHELERLARELLARLESAGGRG